MHDLLAKVGIVSYPFSFSALAWGDPFWICGKTLRILKLESSGQQQWRFGDPSLHRFWLIHSCNGRTDGWTDGRTKFDKPIELRWLKRAIVDCSRHTCYRALKKKHRSRCVILFHRIAKCLHLFFCQIFVQMEHPGGPRCTILPRLTYQLQAVTYKRDCNTLDVILQLKPEISSSTGDALNATTRYPDLDIAERRLQRS